MLVLRICNFTTSLYLTATLDGDAADSLYNIMKQLSETVETVKSIAHACGVLPISKWNYIVFTVINTMGAKCSVWT